MTEQILAIAPILPKSSNGAAKSPLAQPPLSADKQSGISKNSENLIDLDSRPPSTAPPEKQLKGNPMHPTSNPQPALQPQTNSTNQNSLLDDDHDHGVGGLSERMKTMSTHEPLQPGAHKLKRTDTDTGENETFVDAEG